MLSALGNVNKFKSLSTWIVVKEFSQERYLVGYNTLDGSDTVISSARMQFKIAKDCFQAQTSCHSFHLVLLH